MKKITGIHPVFSFFFIFLFLLFVSTCTNEPEFTIEGEVRNASGSKLYLEHVDVSRTFSVDSVLLNANGKFKFKQPVPETPDFYRLRLGNQYIDLVVQEQQTIRVVADSSGFSRNYEIEGCTDYLKMKELARLRDEISVTFNTLDKKFSNKEISEDIYYNRLQEVIKQYKDQAVIYIYEDPGAPSSYYALLQTVNNLVIFNPYDKEDNKTYRAVATQWDIKYPGSARTLHIKNLSLEGMKAFRESKPIEYREDKVINIFDIDLPTIYGNKLRLSDIAIDRVTLLEFTAYEAPGSSLHNMELNVLYEKYKDRGFTIYQVSLDTDEHNWKNAATNLPWLCVRDPASVYSQIARNYNVVNLPTGFLIDREGEVVKRVESYADLDGDINKIIK